MFVCACASLVFVGNASAQIKSDDIVTIKNGDNYLGVNNKADAIVNALNMQYAICTQYAICRLTAVGESGLETC